MASTPAYQRVADELRHRIADGTWLPGAQIPGEHELSLQFSVSRNTIRQALNQLERVNLVRRQQGAGTFVSRQGVTHTLGDLRSFTQVMDDLGLAPGIQGVTVQHDPTPPAEARDFLPGSHLWLIRRVRLNGTQPFTVMESWVPDEIGSAISPAQLRASQSLYALFSDRRIVLREANEKIRAEAATPELAAELEVPVGYPLLTIHRWTSDRAGRAVEYVRSYSPGDRYEYLVKLTQ